MFKRLLIHIKDKLNEPTYRELWEKQNKTLDENKVEKRKLLKQIVKLKNKIKDLEEQNG